MLKRTHRNLSFKSPLLPPLPPPFILTLLHPCCGPLGHLPPRLLEAVYSARTRGPSAGTMVSFRETINPMAEQGSLQGGQPTPFPQTSQPSATLSAYTYMSHTLTDTHLVSLSTTDIPECCSEICTVQTGGSSSEPTATDFLKSCRVLMFHLCRTLILV